MEKWGLKFGKLVPKVKPADIAQSWKIFKGDMVKVIAGKCKGEEGKVLDIKRKQNLVYVEGVNIARKHVPTTPLGKGTIYNVEQGMHVSNLSLIDPVHKVPTRVGWKFEKDENGFEHKVRIAKMSGSELPRPPIPERKRVHSDFATDPAEVAKITFTPDMNKRPMPEDCLL